MTPLPERLREQRNKHGLSQKDVAMMLGITPSAYGLYERGKRDPDTDTLVFLAKRYGVSTDYLLGITDDPTPTNLPTDKTPAQELLEIEAKLRAAGYRDDDIHMISSVLKRLAPSEKPGNQGP